MAEDDPWTGKRPQRGGQSRDAHHFAGGPPGAWAGQEAEGASTSACAPLPEAARPAVFDAAGSEAGLAGALARVARGGRTAPRPRLTSSRPPVLLG